MESHACGWPALAIPHQMLPPCSMVLTDGGLLAAKITSMGDSMYALVGYVANDARPGRDGEGPRSRFWGREWQRTLNLPYATYAPLIAARQPDALVPHLGKIARIRAAGIVAARSTRDPYLLAAHAAALDALATWCGVDRDKFGVYGSAMYKPPGTARDLDIVVYGRDASRRVAARAAGVVPPRPADHPHHPHFRTPGAKVTLDPRYLTGEHTITRALIAGDCTDSGVEAIDRLWVLDAAEGIFFPSRYTLSDGSVLLSYRAGHSGWLRNGDELFGPPLPVFFRDGTRYRVVLGCETLRARRAEAEQTGGEGER
ncbi:hypothetical protein [Actinomadura rugatobispora]|uniref:Nucleotidyltransferase family protein n=1 Tax=Actinomadura rugatobispora TaxID=1994 RepID=A0ABW1A2F5_9ACTN|nr:hypothetical protein GCM10010200_040920 [Actinomadura rugatobispora]